MPLPCLCPSGGTVLAQATVLGVVDDGSLHDVFWAPVAVVPEQTYYLLFEATNEGGVSDGLLRLGGDSGDPYIRGSLYVNGTESSTVDQAFRTFSDDEFPIPTVSAPSLSGIGLVLLGGLMGLAGWRKVRSRN